MKATILFLAFLYGDTVLNVEFVKAFDTREECENWINDETKGIKRMDKYLEYYRKHKEDVKADYKLTLFCETKVLDKNA